MGLLEARDAVRIILLEAAGFV